MATTAPPPAADEPDLRPEDAAASFPEAEAGERSIPIRPGDLNRLLAADPAISPTERTLLAQLGRLLAAVLHHRFHAWQQELKELYAPFDPDTDCVDIEGLSRTATRSADEAFLRPFEAALLRANYRPLHLDVIEEAISAPNEKGLTYIPDFSLFEHMKVYVRGTTRVSRVVRKLKTRFRKTTIEYDGYQRFAVALKFKEGMELDDYVRSDVIYLRMFKDVPKVDMEMHLPEQGIRVKMRLIDKAQVASPLIMFPATLAMKFMAWGIGMMAFPTVALGSLMVAPISAGINSFFGFKRAQQRHLHAMIRHLYYLTMANNASVITKIIDSAEEEEYKEALLAYYCLWRHADDPEPFDQARLDRCVECLLRDKGGVAIDFEIGDALHKLRELGLCHEDQQGRLSVVPIERALAILDSQWDDYFRYAKHGQPSGSAPKR